VTFSKVVRFIRIGDGGGRSPQVQRGKVRTTQIVWNTALPARDPNQRGNLLELQPKKVSESQGVPRVLFKATPRGGNEKTLSRVSAGCTAELTLRESVNRGNGGEERVAGEGW